MKEALKKLPEISNDISRPFLTWDPKQFLVKAKLLPQISYNTNTYPLKGNARIKVENLILSFVEGKQKFTPPFETLQLPKNKDAFLCPVYSSTMT